MALPLLEYIAAIESSQRDPSYPKPDFQYVSSSSEEDEDEGYASADHSCPAFQIRARDILQRRRRKTVFKQSPLNCVTNVPWGKRRAYPLRRPHTRSWTCENIWLDPKCNGHICSRPLFVDISMSFETYLRDFVSASL